MVELIKEDVPNIICIQPFGCLPNHIVGKGVAKKVRELYPMANIAAIDYDPGASEVNQLNRIKLMLSGAQKNLQRQEAAEAAAKAKADSTASGNSSNGSSTENMTANADSTASKDKNSEEVA